MLRKIKAYLKNKRDEKELKQSNYGRYYGWYIERNGEQIGELVSYQYDEMFWDRYTIIPYHGYENRLLHYFYWLQHDFQYSNKHYPQYAKNAVFGGEEITKKGTEYTILMRGLYLLSIKDNC